VAPLLLLNADDVRGLIDLPTLFGALEAALRDLSAGRASVPPRVVVRTPDGFLGSMPGYLPGTALEAKLVAVFPGNHERGLPSHQALIALFDEETGVPLCVMDGTIVTAVRTGATAAVAARALARDDARTLAILGAGVQGRSHLDAFASLFELDEIRVASRTGRHADELAELLDDVLRPLVVAVRAEARVAAAVQDDAGVGVAYRGVDRTVGEAAGAEPPERPVDLHRCLGNEVPAVPGLPKHVVGGGDLGADSLRQGPASRSLACR